MINMLRCMAFIRGIVLQCTLPILLVASVGRIIQVSVYIVNNFAIDVDRHVIGLGSIPLAGREMQVIDPRLPYHQLQQAKTFRKAPL